MTNLLFIALLTSLQIAFIHALFWPGMILERLSQFAEYQAKMLPFWRKPLYECLVCMTSVWGTLLYFVEWHYDYNYVWYLLAVGGFNVVLDSVIQFGRNVLTSLND